MTARTLYYQVTNTNGILSITVEGSYSQVSTSAAIECTSTTLGLGDAISVDLGYDDDHGVIFGGYVKRIERSRPDGVITLTCYDEMIKASDYFMASEDPENPFQRESIGTQQLVRDLLAEASITNVSTQSAGFTWGTNGPAKFNLQTVADAVQFICNIVGFTIYADTSNTVHFASRKPYVDVGDTASVWFSTTGSAPNIISCQYAKSTEKTRNQIIVYGKGDLHASATASNSYLVVDQTVVIGHELLDTSALVNGTATTNLNLLNRLTESYEIETLGDIDIQPRAIASLTESFSGASNRLVFLYRVTHTFSMGSGYTCSITAVP